MTAKSTKSRDISRLVRPSVRKLAAYHVDETPVRVKLDAMENPFPLPDEVRREVAEAVRNAPVNLYPDPSAKELRRSIATMWGMDPERMLLGNGSDELIQALILAFGGPVLFPAPTFAMYELTSKALSERTIAVPLEKDFSLDTDRLVRKAKQARAKLVFLASPNNPTGNRFSDDAVRKVLKSLSSAVVVDEAYYSFSGRTWLPELGKHPNLIILRTLSKIGFAGLRIGALTASNKLVAELNKIRLPYNINMLSQAAAVAVLGHRDVLDDQISRLISERERLYNALTRMGGVTPYPSETNFLLVRMDRNATKVHGVLKQAGILVKNLDRPGPLRNCLRVTVGRPEENDEFLNALSKAIKTPR